MRVEYHPAIEQGVAEAVERYKAASKRLSQEFRSELRRTIAIAAANPNRFHTIKPGFHRANLQRFPYHFIYREILDGIRVTLLRHHRRSPGVGWNESKGHHRGGLDGITRSERTASSP